MLGRRERAQANLGRVLGDPGHHLRLDVCEALCESGCVTVVDPQQVVKHEHLAIGSRSGADPDHRDLQSRHQRLGHGRGDRLEYEREAARILQGERVAGHLHRSLGGSSLGLVAAERGRGLRGQADMAHHRNPGIDDRARALDAGAAALELDGVTAGLLDEPLRGLDRLRVASLIGAKREVADQKRGLQPPAHR